MLSKQWLEKLTTHSFPMDEVMLWVHEDPSGVLHAKDCRIGWRHVTSRGLKAWPECVDRVCPNCVGMIEVSSENSKFTLVDFANFVAQLESHLEEFRSARWETLENCRSLLRTYRKIVKSPGHVLDESFFTHFFLKSWRVVFAQEARDAQAEAIDRIRTVFKTEWCRTFAVKIFKMSTPDAGVFPQYVQAAKKFLDEQRDALADDPSFKVVYFPSDYRDATFYEIEAIYPGQGDLLVLPAAIAAYVLNRFTDGAPQVASFPEETNTQELMEYLKVLFTPGETSGAYSNLQVAVNAALKL